MTSKVQFSLMLVLLAFVCNTYAGKEESGAEKPGLLDNLLPLLSLTGETPVGHGTIDVLDGKYPFNIL